MQHGTWWEKLNVALRFRRQKLVDKITVFVDIDFAVDPVSKMKADEAVMDLVKGCSIKVQSLVGTRSRHRDRRSPIMEWIGALHDRTNWCRLGVSWKQTDQMSSSEREVSIASLKGFVQISMSTSVTEQTNALCENHCV